MIFPRDNQQHGAARTDDPLVFLRTVRRKQAAKQIAAGVRCGKMENAGHHIENRLLPFRRFIQGQLRNIHPQDIRLHPPLTQRVVKEGGIIPLAAAGIQNTRRLVGQVRQPFARQPAYCIG